MWEISGHKTISKSRLLVFLVVALQLLSNTAWSQADAEVGEEVIDIQAEIFA